jgi:hypothetical protein
MIVVGPDVIVVIGQVVLKDFDPNYLEFQTQSGSAKGTLAYGDQTVIELAAACDLVTTLTFKGTCALDGKGHIMNLSTDGNIVVSPDSVLTLRNITLKGITGTNLRCMSNTTTIFFENVTLQHDANFTFTKGSFEVNHKLVLAGAYAFAYTSTIPSIILNNSMLMLDRGMTFSYLPGSANRNLLTFEDDTAVLYCNGATLAATTTGMRLTQGTLRFNDDNLIVSTAVNNAQAIKFGTGLSDANDVIVEILPGASIEVVSGYLDM